MVLFFAERTLRRKELELGVNNETVDLMAIGAPRLGKNGRFLF